MRRFVYERAVEEIEGLPQAAGLVNWGKWAGMTRWLRKEGSWADWLVSVGIVTGSSASASYTGARLGGRVGAAAGPAGVKAGVGAGAVFGFGLGTFAGLNVVEKYVGSKAQYKAWRDENVQRTVFKEFMAFIEFARLELRDEKLFCPCRDDCNGTMKEVWRTPPLDGHPDGRIIRLECLEGRTRGGVVTAFETRFNRADCRLDAAKTLDVYDRLSRLLDLEIERPELSRDTRTCLADVRNLWADRRREYRQIVNAAAH